MYKAPIDSSYIVYCVVCDNSRCHRMNSMQICPDCSQRMRTQGYSIDPQGAAKFLLDHPRHVTTEPCSSSERTYEPHGFTEEEINEMTYDIGATEGSKSVTQQFTTGAVRGSSELPFHLIHPHALMGVALASGEGSEKYGAYNNIKGFPFSNLYNHAFAHMMLFWWGDTSEDHLGHALWNLSQLKMQFEENGHSDNYIKLDDRPEHDLHIIEALKNHMEQLSKIITSVTPPQEE